MNRLTRTENSSTTSPTHDCRFRLLLPGVEGRGDWFDSRGDSADDPDPDVPGSADDPDPDAEADPDLDPGPGVEPDPEDDPDPGPEVDPNSEDASEDVSDSESAGTAGLVTAGVVFSAPLPDLLGAELKAGVAPGSAADFDDSV